MLSHASKGHNLILMILYIFRVILNCTMTSLTLCCLGMTLPISLCYSSVVNKHQLLALSVLCLFAEFNNGSRAILTVLGNKKTIVSCGKIWIMKYYWR